MIDRRTALTIAGVGMLTWRVTPSPAGAQAASVLNVGGNVDDGITPLLYAMQSGAFARAGIDVKLQTSGNGAAAAAAVVGGGLDIAKSSLMSIVSGYARGVPFRIVGGVAMYRSSTQTDQLCALTTSPIRTFADMSGKKVATPALKGLDVIGTQALIDKDGGDSKTTTFVEMPFSVMLPALESGRVDVAAIADPQLATDLATKKIRAFIDPYEGIAKQFLLAAWFTTSDTIAKKPDLIKRFSRVIVDANAYCGSHHGETVPILAQFTHMDPQVIRSMTRVNYPITFGPEAIQPAIDAAAKYKVIDRTFSAQELFA